MNSIEKNDVDVSKLYAWGAKFKIDNKFSDESFEVYMRLVGDADLNRTRVYALRKSAELRKKLKTIDSDERLAYIPDPDTIDEEQLIQVILMDKIRDATERVVKNLRMKMPEEPKSSATLEEQEEYQRIVDEYPLVREKLINEEVNKILTVETEKLKLLGKDTLLRDYERSLINQLCENEMLACYRDACVFYGTYSDEKFTKRFFKSFDELDEFQKDIKDQLINSYMMLEVGGEDLKKLLGVTQ
jgi:hypothetical protein